MKLSRRLIGCLALLGIGVAVTGVALWLLRDRPGRAVEAVLENRLGTRVSIGRITPRGFDRWRLERLRIEQPPAWPWIDRVTIDEIEVEGSLGAVTSGRFRAVEVRGLEARLRASRRPPVPMPPSTLEIDRLLVEDARLVAAPRGGLTAPIDLGAELFDLGRAMHGSVRFDAPDFAPRPWLRVFDWIPAGWPSSDHDRSCSPESAHARIEFATNDQGVRQAVLAADLPWTTAARAEAQLITGEAMPFDLAISGIDPSCWLPPVDGLDYQGTVDIKAARSAPSEPLEVSVRGALDRLAWQDGDPAVDLTASKLILAVDAVVQPAEGLDHGPLTLQAIVEGLGGQVAGKALPSALPALEASLDGRLATGGELTLAGAWQARLGPLGTLTADGAVWRQTGWTWPRVELDWRWRDASPAWLVAQTDGLVPGIARSMRSISATGRVESTLDRPTVRAAVVVEEPVIAAGDGTWRLRTKRLPVDVETQTGSGRRKIEIASAEWRLERPERPAFTLPIHGRYLLDPIRPPPEPSRQTLALDLGGLGRIDASGDVGGPIELAWSDGAVPVWAELVAGETLPAGVSLDGRLAARGSLTGRALDALAFDGLVTLDDAGFRTADATRAAEGTAARLEVAVRPEDGGRRLRIAGDLDGPVLLWRTLFADWSALSTRLSVEARVHAGENSGDSWSLVARVDPQLGETGAGTGSGSVVAELTAEARSGRDPTWRFALAADDLAGAFEHLVRRPFAGSSPRIDGLHLAGHGHLEVALRPAESTPRIAAELRLGSASVATPGDGLVVDGLHLVLPVRLPWPLDEEPLDAATVPPVAGRVQFDRLSARGVAFAPVGTAIEVAGDTLRLGAPLTSAVAGGTITLEGFTLADMFSERRELRTAVVLDGLDLGRLTRALGLPPLAGRLDGEVPGIRLRRTAFEVDGQATARLFGGTVRLYDMAGKDLFAPFPRLTFSADIAEIDLALVTAAFEVGRMAGRIEGEVRACTVVGTQPVACSARIASAEPRQGPRWIDLEAVNNLSVLGTGGGIERGLARRFLRRFTYDKLGVSVRLANDRFLLRGLVHRDDKELFLAGRLPFPINIVNATPGTYVSFEAMLDRLRHLEDVRLTRGQRQTPEKRP